LLQKYHHIHLLSCGLNWKERREILVIESSLEITPNAACNACIWGGYFVRKL